MTYIPFRASYLSPNRQERRKKGLHFKKKSYLYRKTRENMDRIADFLFSMTPDIKERVMYGNQIQLYDNLEGNHREDTQNDSNYALPAKMKFSSSLFCRRGWFRIRVNLIDYELHEGDFISFITDSIVDSFSKSDDCSMIAIFFANDGDSTLFDLDFVKFFLNRILAEPFKVSLTPYYAAKYEQTYLLMKELMQQEDFRYRKETLQGCLKIMAGLTAQCITTPPAVTQHRNEEIFNRFLKLVRQHYRTHRELTFYADQLCLTPKYLGKAIHEYSGRYPSDLIKGYVILEAKALLRSGNYTVKEIADQLNFPNPSFFGKYFKEAVGCSPMKF